MSKSHEKRENHRVPLDTRVRYSVEGQQWKETRSQDVSRTGILLRSEEPVEPGQTVRLLFRLPHFRYQDPIKAHAEVMRVIVRQGRQTGFALKFVTLQSGQYQVVEEFVSRILGLPISGGFEELGEVRPKGGYSYSMEKLAQEAVEREAKSEERKIVLSGPSTVDRVFRLLKYTAMGLVGLLCFYVLYHLGYSFVSMIMKVGKSTP